MLTMNIQGRGGDRAHEATTILVREAWRAAGDPAMYPEQIQRRAAALAAEEAVFHVRRGVRRAGGEAAGGPGAARRTRRRQLRRRDSRTPAAPPPKLARVNTATYDPLLGRTYAEIGSDARSNHKCQGTGGLPPLPGVAGGRGGGRRRLAATSSWTPRIPGQMGKDETSLFDGIDTSLAALAQFAGPNPPAALTAGLAAIVDGGEARAEGVRRGQRRRHGGAGRSRTRGRAGSARAARLACRSATRRGTRSISVSRSRSATTRTPSSLRMA